MRLIHTACWFLLLTPLVAWAGEYEGTEEQFLRGWFPPR
jgi:hypothetical protein